MNVYDVTGREVGTLVDGVKEEGEYSLKYDAEELRSGVYFVRIISNNEVETTKFVKE